MKTVTIPSRQDVENYMRNYTNGISKEQEDMRREIIKLDEEIKILKNQVKKNEIKT
jgi:hypothetical protein